MTTAVTILDEHERALDYLYGLLDGEEKARFEAHLATCARCQAELEANGRVRTAAKAVLPIVEPTERLTGALHTQLLHEAAQHASRGKVLPFLPRLVRRVVRHPAYAAAAGLLIVGGAIGLQWSRGRLTMPPPPAHEEAMAPAAPPAGAALPVDEPVAVATPTPSPPKVVSPPPAAATSVGSVAKEQKPAAMHASRAPAKDDASLDDMMLERANGGLKGKLVGGGAGNADKNELSSRDGVASDESKVAEKAPKAGPADDYERRAYKKERNREEQNDSSRGALAQNAPAPASKSAPAVAPAEPPAPVQSESNADARRMNAPQQAYGKGATGYAPSNAQGNVQSAAPNTYATTDLADRFESDRQKAAELASAGRCEEAATLYDSLERRLPQRLDPKERLEYARCLRVLGRLDPAQNELNQVAGSRRAPAAAFAAEQQALTSERMKQNAVRNNNSNKAKRAADADSTNDANQAPAAGKPSR